MLSFKKMDAYRIFLIYGFMMDFCLTVIWTLATLYLIREVGLDPLQLVLVGTALEISAFTFEIPTGVIADVYSRRLSVILGACILGIGFMIVGLTTLFGVILLSQVIAGLGYTFISGAGTAWLADEIGEEAAGKAYIRSSQVGQIAGLLAIIVSVALASITLALPIIIGSGLLILTAFFLALFMPEDGFTPAPKEERETWGAMQRTFTDGIKAARGRPVLVTLLIIGVIYGAYTEGFDRLWQFHVLNNFTLPFIGDVSEEVWFGVIGIIGSLIGMVFTEFTRRRVETSNSRSLARALFIINALLITSAAIFALAQSFAFAMIAFWMIGPLRGLNGPLQSAWINQGLDPKVRATVNSMNAQSDAIGQMAGGPGIGLIGRIFGVRVALVLGAVILSPVLLLYGRRLGGEEALLEEAAVIDIEAAV